MNYIISTIEHNEHFQYSRPYILGIEKFETLDDFKDKWHNELYVTINDENLDKLRKNKIEYYILYIYDKSRTIPSKVILLDEYNAGEISDKYDYDVYLLSNYIDIYDGK